MPYAAKNPSAFSLDRALACTSTDQLLAMQAAGREVLECRRVLRKADLNVVGEVLKGQGEFFELEHYPHDDVHDEETHSQYYYHSHRGTANEHGHFHTFLRAAGMAPNMAPVAHDGPEIWPAGEEALSHLVAIAMDDYGEPIGLFTVNRWVCGDTWYSAADVIRMAMSFRIDHAFPSWPVNRWLTAMLALYLPQIEWLLQARDAAVAAWAKRHPGRDVFEDRILEITSELPLSIDEQIAAVDALLARRQLDEEKS
ncbi:MAG: hypothetical protein JNM32_11825 [Dechloromonas sp.]|nr:hypothetical protein [Dechloromonas sp.]